MRYVLVLLAFCSIAISANAQFKHIFVDTLPGKVFNHPHLLAAYDDQNICINVDFSRSNPETQELNRVGSSVIVTKDAGKTWDTIKHWYYTIPVADFIPEYPKIFAAEYFDKNKISFLNKDGFAEQYYLNDNKSDTFSLYPKQQMNETNLAYWHKTNDSTLIYSGLDSYEFKKTTNRGLNWSTIKKASGWDLFLFEWGIFPNYQLTPAYFTTIPNSEDIYQIHAAKIMSANGYTDSLLKMVGAYYSAQESKWTLTVQPKDYSLEKPAFYNENLGFINGHKVYFKTDNMNPDSVYKKPVMLKTTNKGLTWEKVFESEYFIGNSGNTSKIFGDTILQPFYGYNRFGLIVSYNRGETWEILDRSNYFPTDKYRIYEYIIINSRQALIEMREHVDGKFNDIVTVFDFYYQSSAEDPKLFLPEMKLYPNPANNFITIDFEAIGAVPTDVRLFDMMGTELKSSDIYKSTGSVMIGTGNLPVGTYLAHIYFGETLLVKSFVIAR